MSHRVLDALRTRCNGSTVLGVAVVVAVLWVFDVSPTSLATTLMVAGITGTTSVVADAYDLRDSVERAGIASLGIFYGVSGVVLEDEPVWLPAGLFALGGWFVLDAVQTIRHDGATVPDDDRDGDEVYQSYVTSRVHETLQDEPHTRRELGEHLAIEEPYLDTAVARLRDREAVVKRGSELRVVERDTGWWASSRRWLARFVGRISRPVTIELSDGSSDS
ncbi:hypothetical protein EGH22_13570 [Halomicroarcula sp. F28]|uniref:hypothetical protein n=1 Tax=Haloarcula salinisoli TaxID=2487746 RepID=UPI001C734C49|nr:hypothetical protein [Halomicroarcula salinisoli]MBX0287360.1 hypothetical protein [Halomicroarcula salinisoli]